MAEIIKQVIKQLGSELKDTYNIPENFFVCKDNKDSVAVWITEPTSGLTKKLVFNYKGTKFHTFIVKNIVADTITIPDTATVKALKSDTINKHIVFKQFDESTIAFIRDTAIYYIKNYEPADKFGCCGKYKECSKAKKCLHDNQFYARACWYKKNLEAGKIFY